MKRATNIAEIVYGELLDYLQRIETVPLLKTTLIEASKLISLLRFIENLIPEVFYAFVISFIFKKPKPIPEAPISSWKSFQREDVGLYMCSIDIGWGYLSISYLKELPSIMPKTLLNFLVSEHRESLKTLRKKYKKKYPTLCCVVLAPDWERVKNISIDVSGNMDKPEPMHIRKFVADFRRLAKEKGIQVLTFKGFIGKYEKTIVSSNFKENWAKYQRELYLDFMKHFPMLAYSLCHDDYLAHRDYKKRAELDLLDGKYPEAVAMSCKALEHILRIYYFMKNMEEAPDKELGWLFQSLRKHIEKEMGEIYCRDLEIVLSHRPYAVHAKKKKKEVTEFDAHEVGSRVDIFCETFFHKKWKAIM